MTVGTAEISSLQPYTLSPAGLAREVDPYWRFSKHLQYAMRKIIECINKPNGRLMIFMPPRHGKSEMVSRFTPAWYLGTQPDKRVILTSYEADFAASWGKKARTILDEFGEDLYGVRVDPSSSANNRWELQKVVDNEWRATGGMMITAGVGGPITGRGADLFIVDDPFKNAQEALSHKIRENVWQWWTSTARTRFQPGASCIIILTRWHEDDLAGRLLNAQKQDPDADHWDVVSMPAIAESDETWTVEDFKWLRSKGIALWPDQYDAATLKRVAASVGSFWWQAMYQQNPQPAENLGKFKRHWFKYVEPDDWPDLQNKLRYWDMAATEKTDPTEDPDWTVGALMGRTSQGTFIEDIVRFRESPGKTDDNVVATAKADGTTVGIRIEQEPGSSGKSMISHYKRHKALQGFAVRGLKTTGNKQIRANPLAAEAEGTDGTDGRLYLKRAEWNKEFIDECVQFPYGPHDDQVDAASGGFEVLTRRERETVSPSGISRTSPWRMG